LKVSFGGLLGGVIAVVVGVFFLCGGWGSYTEYKRMEQYDGRALGHITHKHFQLGSDGSGHYFIDYRFVSPTGEKISATHAINKQQWDMLKVDDTLEIRYNKSDPKQCVPLYGGSPSPVFAFFVFVLGSVLLIFGLMRLRGSFRKKIVGNDSRQRK